jgi:hypothetical protein
LCVKTRGGYKKQTIEFVTSINLHFGEQTFFFVAQNM